MNSLERVNKVFLREEPDRVPTTEFGASEVVWREYGAESLYEFQQMLDYDMMYTRIAYRKSEDDGTYYKDEWGVQFKRTSNESIGHSVGHPIKTPKDIDKLILPDPDDSYRFANLEQVVRDYKGKKSVCFSSRAFFLWAGELCGLDNLLMLMYDEPEFCEELFDRILENQIQVYKNAIAIGADAIAETDDYAYNVGPFMSPDMFDEMIVPRLTKFTKELQKAGARVIKHTDGNVRKILPLIVKCGVDAFQSVDPSAGMDIGEVKREFGNQIAIIGNIDCSNLLCFATPEEVRDVVRETIKAAAPGGGYMLSSSNTLTSITSLDNLRAMMQAVKDFGEYPICL